MFLIGKVIESSSLHCVHSTEPNGAIASQQARHVECAALPKGTVAPESKSHTHFECTLYDTHRRRHKHTHTVSYTASGAKKKKKGHEPRQTEIQTPLCVNIDR